MILFQELKRFYHDLEFRLDNCLVIIWFLGYVSLAFAIDYARD